MKNNTRTRPLSPKVSTVGKVVPQTPTPQTHIYTGVHFFHITIICKPDEAQLESRDRKLQNLFKCIAAAPVLPLQSKSGAPGSYRDRMQTDHSFQQSPDWNGGHLIHRVAFPAVYSICKVSTIYRCLPKIRSPCWSREICCWFLGQ